MDNNTDIAFLAAALEREMRQSLAGSSGLRHNRTDFRNFLPPQAGGTQPQQVHPQQYPQYPQYQYPQQPQPQYAPQNYPQQEQEIPQGVIEPPNTSFIPMPPGYQVRPDPNLQIPVIESVERFNIPDYANQKKYLEDEQEFRDALIKEIKSQKTTISRLSKEIKALTQLTIELKESLSTILNKTEQPSILTEPEPELQQHDTTIQS